MNRRGFLTTMGATPLAAAAQTESRSTPVNIGSRLELLVDEHLIDKFNGGARLRMHQPERREIAIVHDAPWEGCGSGYHTVFRDGDLYRMYYKSWNHEFDRKTVHPLVIAYAESRDGIHWEKPNLGLVEYNGSKKNNIILDDVHAHNAHDFSPFRDTNPAAKSDAVYKAVGHAKPGGLYGLKSTDGIHWKLMQDAPILTKGKFDTQNLAFWDPRIGKYRAYIRDFDGKRRDITTAVSDDFIHWSEPKWLQYPGAPSEQLYTNGIAPYYRAPHLYFGFPARYVDRGWTESTELLPELELRKQRAAANVRYGSAVTDGLFMSSRDGMVFHRWPEAFIRPGLRTRFNWSYGDNYIAWGVMETKSTFDDEATELSLYSTESYFTGTDARLRRYTLRIDGFVSAFASLGGGEMLSKPLIYDGSELAINFSTSAGGSLRFELQDASGRPLPGCELAGCPEMFGDSLRQSVRWKAKPQLSRWAGQPVRLRVEIKDADLFSFQFSKA
ncbi:MAG: hypothetical protein ABIZ80_05000 [Bryobacteraceae bacterium]